MSSDSESLFSQDLCKICNHPQRGEIEKQMLTPGPGASYRAVAASWAPLSAMAVKRHKPHMITAINRQLAKTEDSITTKLLRSVESQVEKLSRWGESAAGDGNYRDAAQCMAVAQKYLEMMAKLHEATGFKAAGPAKVNMPNARFVIAPQPPAESQPAAPHALSVVMLPEPEPEEDEDILDGDPDDEDGQYASDAPPIA